MEKRKWW